MTSSAAKMIATAPNNTKATTPTTQGKGRPPWDSAPAAPTCDPAAPPRTPHDTA